MAEIKKDGYLHVKEDGLRAWIWSKRYVVLREQTITFHRNEVCNTNVCTWIHSHDLLANWSMCGLGLSKRDYSGS
jgi:hypothetical protein